MVEVLVLVLALVVEGSSSRVQACEQPSLSTLLPSSQASPGSTTPSPQVKKLPVAPEEELAAPVGWVPGAQVALERVAPVEWALAEPGARALVVWAQVVWAQVASVLMASALALACHWPRSSPVYLQSMPMVQN